MCGLYASIGFSPDPRHLDIVSHRGPDGRGWRTFDSPAGPLALGHRRLAIVDLDERAAQPMSCSDERFWITFNGEIYNFVELRAELEATGCVFRTTSDTEVLIQAYAAWGEAMLGRLLGMFAFVIYDARDQTVFAARDRFGMKPLYYFLSHKGLAFASEIKQLVDQPGFARRVNHARAFDYLSVGYTDHTEETMFADARQLRGGQCVTLDLRRWRHGQALPVRRYYDLVRSAAAPMSEAKAARQFRTLFDDAVRIHMRSDVRVGSCLSGGLDSSSIVMVMDQCLKAQGVGEPIHTVSACYEEKEVDEKPYMDMVVAAVAAAPHFIYPGAERAMEIAERMVWHQDEPYYNTSMYAQWCVFEEASRHGIKVMLNGQGADEQLAGYQYESFDLHARTLLGRGDIAGVMRMILERKQWYGASLKSQLLSLRGQMRLPAWARRFKSAQASVPGAAMLETDLMTAARSSGGTLQDILDRDSIGELSDIGILCVANTMSSILPRLLRYEDRNSMAHSIEARLPFLDHRLVEFNLGLWDRHKVVGGETKRVLRRAMADLLPDAVRRRRDKLGFATPQEKWFRGPLRSSIESAVHDAVDLFPGLLDRDEVLNLVRASMEGRRSADSGLWMLVNLGLWGRVFGMSQ